MGAALFNALNAVAQSWDSWTSWVRPLWRCAAAAASGGGGDASAACAWEPSWAHASFTWSASPAPARRWDASLLNVCSVARCAAPHTWRALVEGGRAPLDVVVVAALLMPLLIPAPQLPGTHGLPGAWAGLPWLVFAGLPPQAARTSMPLSTVANQNRLVTSPPWARPSEGYPSNGCEGLMDHRPLLPPRPSCANRVRERSAPRSRRRTAAATGRRPPGPPRGSRRPTGCG